MMPLKEMVGKKFGKVSVIKRYTPHGISPVKWLCLCKCGKEFVTPGARLRRGSTKSCGCSRGEFIGLANKKHGLSGTRLHKIWSHMIERCTTESHKQYVDYGGRGITVCEDWLTFENFYNWALKNGYEDSLSIDRIDVNGNYEPSNCRWADHYMQANNTRVTVKVAVNNETLSISEWSKRTGINRNTLYKRFRSGIRGVRFIEPINQNYSRV